MYPGALISNIRHLEKIWIEPGLPDCFSEQRFVSPRGTRSDDNSIKLVFLNYFLYPLLSILRTSEEISLSIDHVGQGLGKFSGIRDIYIPADIDSAVADEDPDSRLFSSHILFWRVFSLPW